MKSDFILNLEMSPHFKDRQSGAGRKVQNLTRGSQPGEQLLLRSIVTPGLGNSGCAQLGAGIK